MISFSEYTSLNESFSSDMLRILGRQDLNNITDILTWTGLSDVNIQATTFETKTNIDVITLRYPSIYIVVDKTSKNAYLWDTEIDPQLPGGKKGRNIRWKLGDSKKIDITKNQFLSYISKAIRDKHELVLFEARKPVRDRGKDRSFSR